MSCCHDSCCREFCCCDPRYRDFSTKESLSSSATGDGGILVGSGSAFSASAFIFDDSEDRWGVQIDTQLGSTAATAAPEAYASLYVLTANTGSATYNVKGNIKIDDGTGDIFIYS